MDATEKRLKKTAPDGWERVKWDGNSGPPYCDWECYRKRIGRLSVILNPRMWSKEGWSYVVEKPESEAHSGFLKGITDLAEAKAELEKRFANYP